MIGGNGCSRISRCGGGGGGLGVGGRFILYYFTLGLGTC